MKKNQKKILKKFNQKKFIKKKIKKIKILNLGLPNPILEVKFISKNMIKTKYSYFQ
jgi:hypothetical protein